MKHLIDIEELCGYLTLASSHCANGEHDAVQKVLGDAIRFARQAQPEAPIPQVEPTEQVRMSEADIRRWWGSDSGLEDMDLCKFDDFLKVVRAVEQEAAKPLMVRFPAQWAGGELLTPVEREARGLPREFDTRTEPTVALRKTFIRLLLRGYSEGWSDHKQDRQHGMTPAKLDAAIRDVLNLSRR